MTVSRWLRPCLSLILVILLVVTGCSSAPSKYDQVQEDTTGFKAPAAVEKGAEQGSKFNRFFPASEGAFKVVPSQEKQGFAEYKLKRDGETLAMLTINDTISLPAAAKKYEDATESLAGFPLVEQGTTATGLLVNGRYQVKVLSRSDSFTASDRSTWLEKFDLDGLADLEADTKAFRRVEKKRAKAAPTPPSTPAAVETVPEATAVVEPTADGADTSTAPDTSNSSAPDTTVPATGPNSTLETSPFLVPTPAS